MIFTCPTGLTVNVRKLKVAELNFLMDRKRFKEPFADPLLEKCIVGIENPGVYVEGAPYAWKPGAAFDWKEATVGDRTAALIAIYRATYGDLYDYDPICASADCQKRIRWSVPISKLSYTLCSDETLALYRAGNKAPFKMGGVDIIYKVLLTGSDAVAAEALIEDNQDRMMSVALSQRLLSITGVNDQQKLAWIDNLDGDEMLGLRDVLSKNDAGYDNEFLVECGKCGMQQQGALPLDRTFFLPGRKRRI